LHNIRGFARKVTINQKQGNYILEKYFLNGKRHNINGPAIISYKNGKKEYEEYRVNDNALVFIYYGVNGLSYIHYKDGRKIEI